MLIALILALPVQHAKAQFVLAWDYDSESGNGFDYDAYGQGFYMFSIFENGSSPSGSWTNVGAIHYFNQTQSFNWTVGYGLRIDYYIWMNSTLTGATDLTDGQDYIRLNITVLGLAGTELESQEDLSVFYQSSFWDAEMWLYGYQFIMNLIPSEGQILRITSTLEIYW